MAKTIPQAVRRQYCFLFCHRGDARAAEASTLRNGGLNGAPPTDHIDPYAASWRTVIEFSHAGAETIGDRLRAKRGVLSWS